VRERGPRSTERHVCGFRTLQLAVIIEVLSKSARSEKCTRRFKFVSPRERERERERERNT
jgi:hypothetical protein